METNSLQILGEAIFAFMLSTMTITPSEDGNIYMCVQHPDNENVSCAVLEQERMCTIPESIKKPSTIEGLRI